MSKKIKNKMMMKAKMMLCCWSVFFAGSAMSNNLEDLVDLDELNG